MRTKELANEAAGAAGDGAAQLAKIGYEIGKSEERTSAALQSLRQMLWQGSLHSENNEALAIAFTHRLVRVVMNATVANRNTKMALITLCDECAADRYDWVADSLIERGERALEDQDVEFQEAILGALLPAHRQYRVRGLAYRMAEASDNEFVRETAAPMLSAYSMYDATVRYLKQLLGVANPSPVLMRPHAVSGAGAAYEEGSADGETLRVSFEDATIQFQAQLPSHPNETVRVGITCSDGSICHAEITLNDRGEGNTTIGVDKEISPESVQVWWDRS